MYGMYGQVKSSQVGACQDMPSQFESSQIKSGQVKSSCDRSSYVLTGQIKSGLVSHKFFGPNIFQSQNFS